MSVTIKHATLEYILCILSQRIYTQTAESHMKLAQHLNSRTNLNVTQCVFLYKTIFIYFFYLKLRERLFHAHPVCSF